MKKRRTGFDDMMKAISLSNKSGMTLDEALATIEREREKFHDVAALTKRWAQQTGRIQQQERNQFMTGKELLFFIDDQQKNLGPVATQLLLHLITTGIRQHTHVVQIGERTLEDRLFIDRFAVRLAAQHLERAGLITIEIRAGVANKYIMPVEWFAGEVDQPQREDRPYRIPGPFEVFN